MEPFQLNTSGALQWYEALQSFPEVRAAFSTRLGGVSPAPWHSLNLGTFKRDDNRRVQENYRRYGLAVGVPYQNVVYCRQTHSTHVRRVGMEDAGKGLFRPTDLIHVDGLVTNQKGLCLVTHHADCAALYFYDPIHKAIGLSHAGWRGTLNGMAGATLQAMAEQFNTRPQDVFCAISPSIGPCCFEVDGDVADAFLEKFPHDGLIKPFGNGKFKIDLWRCNRLQMIRAGVPEEQIQTAGICTCCNTGVFFSHRGDRAAYEGPRPYQTGTLAALMALV